MKTLIYIKYQIILDNDQQGTVYSYVVGFERDGNVEGGAGGERVNH